MKTLKQYKTAILFSLFIVISCVQDNAFEVPDITITDPTITANSDLGKVKTALQQAFFSNQKLVFTFPVNENNPTYIEAYVISTDATGNFYNKLIVQDKAENPTAGIEILINKSALSDLFSVGQKIFIKLDGLSVSYDDGQSTVNPINLAPGKYSLGFLEGDRAGKIPSTAIKNHLFRTSTIVPIIPQKITIENITGATINTFVQLEKAQFDISEKGRTFAGERYDEYDGFRYVFECGSEHELRLQTSTFSSFKSTLIPNGQGKIDFILSKDFKSEFLVAIVNSPSTIDFTNTTRCDPVFLNCPENTSVGNVILIDENFENLKTNSQLLNAGWSNINANGGKNVFKSKTKNGNRVIEMSAYNTSENPLETWLISPAINLDTTTNETLTFETNNGYDNGKALKVFISSDFSVDVKAATWTLINATVSVGPSSDYSNFFTKSGNISLSCLSGNVHIAFQYFGGDGGVSTTVQIDNVKITGN
ncbi:hypothetical protein KCTC32516_00731 [Polaribacter huanghezhanensis]|uniref:DUF5689 domain-containing protein n=1 Tax=Polaribacter huanghezhanensis TaxID=1354726 RepID=UPI002649046F|nr:DUF5689 domain-containing protein [Polaribacter huanghezhanensis]WKD85391.1 hypothetical protein KCTC32516_00731 [Polaribacter huanghezhanensis]